MKISPVFLETSHGNQEIDWCSDDEFEFLESYIPHFLDGIFSSFLSLDTSFRDSIVQEVEDILSV